MPRSSKNTTKVAAPKLTPASEPSTAASTDEIPSRTKRATSGRKSPAKKKSAGETPKKGTDKSRRKGAKPTEPSDAEIRLRAYFIAERRVQQALQGDPAKDWLEAKQQLEQESKRER